MVFVYNVNLCKESLNTSPGKILYVCVCVCHPYKSENFAIP